MAMDHTRVSLARLRGRAGGSLSRSRTSSARRSPWPFARGRPSRSACPPPPIRSVDHRPAGRARWCDRNRKGGARRGSPPSVHISVFALQTRPRAARLTVSDWIKLIGQGLFLKLFQSCLFLRCVLSWTFLPSFRV
jgi:hypothetical protein